MAYMNLVNQEGLIIKTIKLTDEEASKVRSVELNFVHEGFEWDKILRPDYEHQRLV